MTRHARGKHVPRKSGINNECLVGDCEHLLWSNEQLRGATAVKKILRALIRTNPIVQNVMGVGREYKPNNMPEPTSVFGTNGQTE